MKTRLIFIITMAVEAVSFGGVPDVSEDFEAYDSGATFVAATNGWQASGLAAYVTNGAVAQAGDKALFMENTVAVTNTLNADANLKLWSDFWINPIIGIVPQDAPTNTTGFLGFFNENGFIEVATPSGWQVCSNDIFGNAVPPATNNTYVRFSFCQDYSTSNQAVFLNDQLILQDSRFSGTPTMYRDLVIQNTYGNCWLDNVWVKTNVNGLTANRNGDALADADEIQQYGYARRTLHVCQTPTNLVPLYTNLQTAINAWRPRDSIEVGAGSYAENLTLTQNVDFVGANFAMGNLTVMSNTTVSFSQGFSCGTLTVSGQVALIPSASLTSSAANVAGSLAVASNAAFVVTGALDVTGTGRLDFTNAQFVATAAGVVMNGTFAISNTWGTTVSMTLPFSDDFELYATNAGMNSLQFRGWHASDGTVKVQDATAHAGKAVVLPDGTVLDSSIDATTVNPGTTKLWTDLYIQPVLGVKPEAAPTNTRSFLAYTDVNGHLVVATQGGEWVVCSNQLDNSPAPLLQSNGFTRVTVCQDFSVTPSKAAVFVAGKLVAQGLSAPANISGYTAFEVENRQSSTFLDDVLITATYPTNLTSDLDHDGVADAYEIDRYGLTTLFPQGSLYRFK